VIVLHWSKVEIQTLVYGLRLIIGVDTLEGG